MSPSQSSTETEPDYWGEPTACIESHLDAGWEAMDAIEGYNQEAVDDLARAVAWAVVEEKRCAELTACCARETGLGTRAGTRAKLQEFIKRALADLLGEPSVGRIGTDREGVTEVAKPVGVIGALVPSTNPASTTAFLAMLAVKGRNAIVISPPPTAVEIVDLTVSYIREELGRIGAPRDLVRMVETPVSRAKAETLLELADFAHVTGSEQNVAAGETAGTPNYCVGAGNATAIVDNTADVRTAAAAIATGAGFDNGGACTSESNVVVDERIAELFLDALGQEGGYVCSPQESTRVADVLFDDGRRTRSLIAQPAAEVAAAAGLTVGDEPAFLALRADDDPSEPLACEKLAPVVTVYMDRGFDQLLDRVGEILATEGAGHSCTIHTTVRSRIERVACEVDVCRAVANQPGGYGLGGHGNDLDTSLCLGAGVWGGNQLDENLSYRQFITTTRVARPTDRETPDQQELFGDYRRKTRLGN